MVPPAGVNPFRFGIQAHHASSASAWAEMARKVEDLGYGTLSVPDHLDDQLAPIAALAAAAAATSTIRLGAMVFCNDYRHPAVLAKEAATLDLLSDGRLELGLGAGWKSTDYEQAGITLDRPGTRIDRLAEAVTIVKALLGGGPVHHEGRHYRITGLEGRPLPVQQPHPPVVVGGGGRRVLELAAREADIVGINVNLRAGEIGPDAGPDATEAATDQKLGWIRAAAGTRFSRIELQTRVHIAAITPDPAGLAAAVAPGLGIGPEAALRSPHALAGTVGGVVDILLHRRERFGISYITISDDAVDDFAPVVARLAGT